MDLHTADLRSEYVKARPQGPRSLSIPCLRGRNINPSAPPIIEGIQHSTGLRCPRVCLHESPVLMDKPLSITSFSMLVLFAATLLAILAEAPFAIGFQTSSKFSTRDSNNPASTNLNASGCPLGRGRTSSRVVNSSESIWPYQVFRSATFNPPQLQITANGEHLAPGLLFFAPTDFTSVNATQDQAPLIMTDAGQLVWNGPNLDATNFRVASYEGNPILTFWSGLSTAGANVGHGYGNVTFLDSSYTEILTVCPKLGLVTPDNTTYPCELDLHESYVTDRDTILVTAYNATATDLRSIGGPKNGWVFDCLFFEINPKDGSILFRWSALDHVPVSESKYPLRNTGKNQSQPFDYFHINSVVNIGDNFLVNSRHVWTTYLVSATGDIIWTVQGDTGGDFGPLPPNGHFVRITCSF